jgi:excisionase family DNA binding protein
MALPSHVGQNGHIVSWGTNLDRKKESAMADPPQADTLLTPAEVAALFRVNPKTVTRWARAGKITAIRTLGGHRRFRSSEIRRCLEQLETGQLV